MTTYKILITVGMQKSITVIWASYKLHDILYYVSDLADTHLLSHQPCPCTKIVFWRLKPIWKQAAETFGLNWRG